MQLPLAGTHHVYTPHQAASIVFDSPLPVVMAGLNVTHEAIFTPQLHRRLLLSGQADKGQSMEELYSHSSPLRKLLSSAMMFFTATYAAEFGFDEGPPVHDMVAVAYVLDPSLFYRRRAGGAEGPAQRYAVKIDTSMSLTAGTTVVDFHNQWGVDEADTWQAGSRNAIVLEHVDVSSSAHVDCIQLTTGLDGTPLGTAPERRPTGRGTCASPLIGRPKGSPCAFPRGVFCPCQPGSPSTARHGGPRARPSVFINNFSVILCCP